MYFQFAEQTEAKDSREWGLIAKTNPYPLLPNPKTPYKNDWKDESGDDEYNAPGTMVYEAFEFSVSFYLKAKTDEVASAQRHIRTKMLDLVSKMQASGEFAYYDSYTDLGWKQVRYAGYNEESFDARDDWARVIFSMKFKVVNPESIATFNGSQIE